MKRVYTVINRKGGTSKSVTATNLAAALSQMGNKVLLIDLDQQGSSVDMLGGHTDEATITEFLTGEMNINEVIQETPYTDLITADTALAGIDEYLRDEDKTNILKEAVKVLKNQYDYCIFDCSGELSQLNLAALLASDGVIVPTLASVLSLRGVEGLNEFVDLAKEMGNKNLKIEGILLTQFDGRNRMSREVKEVAGEMARDFGSRLFKTPIRRTVKVEESILAQTPIVQYAPKSTAGEDYIAWAQELIGEGYGQK